MFSLITASVSDATASLGCLAYGPPGTAKHKVVVLTSRGQRSRPVRVINGMGSSTILLPWYKVGGGGVAVSLSIKCSGNLDWNSSKTAARIVATIASSNLCVSPNAPCALSISDYARLFLHQLETAFDDAKQRFKTHRFHAYQ